jgi:septum formation inhibitor-activating ATPase MinD
VEKYQTVVIDAGRWISDELVAAALQSSSAIFLVMGQDFPAIRNAQRYIAALMRLGFNQEQLKVVINQYQKKPSANLATLEQIQQTLNQPVFYGIPESPAVLAAINRGRPFVADRTAAGDLDGALENRQRSLEIFTHLAEADPKNVLAQQSLGISYMHLAEVLTALDRRTEAIANFQRASEILTKTAESSESKIGAYLRTIQEQLDKLKSEEVRK